MDFDDETSKRSVLDDLLGGANPEAAPATAVSAAAASDSQPSTGGVTVEGVTVDTPPAQSRPTFKLTRAATSDDGSTSTGASMPSLPPPPPGQVRHVKVVRFEPAVLITSHSPCAGCPESFSIDYLGHLPLGNF